MHDVTATDRSEEPGILLARVSQKLVSLAPSAIAAVRDADHAKSIMEYFSIDLKFGACVATPKSVFGDQCFVQSIAVCDGSEPRQPGSEQAVHYRITQILIA
jgi:hypothetical protein